jgi:hypothetical protein
MRRSYRILALAVLAGAALVVVTARPRHAAVTRPEAALSSARVERTVSLAIAGGTVVPERVLVPKGAVVAVTVANRDAAAHRIALLGYEREVAGADLLPGQTRSIHFVADRPGSDFAWLVDGNPAGILVVEGSHLVEGHR